MQPLVLLVLFTCLGSLAVADDLQSTRTWTGVNGKTFHGTFHQLSPDKTKVDILNDQGKIVTVAVANLIESDQKLVTGPSPQPAAPGKIDLSAYKPAPEVNRGAVPKLDPKDYNISDSESMVDALWVSFLWWSQSGVLEVPKKGGLERKAEWLHKELTRHVAEGGRSVSSLSEVKEGVLKYFEKELADVATCRVTVESGKQRAARLGYLARGENIVVLMMSMSYANGRDYSVCSVLESMDEEGTFAIHVFGKRFTGRLKAMPLEGAQQEGGPVTTAGWEYVLDNRKDLPDYYAENGAKFFMGIKPWNGVLMVKPYVYLTPGKPTPLPPEPTRKSS